mmetsp:Transcript_47715/g.74451  ORF Transcript_47715/g.74451 Transcript_47715/m.74451 type:complete len:201 (-) Transcript_47715:278-880(-)
MAKFVSGVSGRNKRYLDMSLDDVVNDHKAETKAGKKSAQPAASGGAGGKAKAESKGGARFQPYNAKDKFGAHGAPAMQAHAQMMGRGMPMMGQQMMPAGAMMMPNGMMMVPMPMMPRPMQPMMPMMPNPALGMGRGAPGGGVSMSMSQVKHPDQIAKVAAANIYIPPSAAVATQGRKAGRHVKSAAQLDNALDTYFKEEG